MQPTAAPTMQPTAAPTMQPTAAPTMAPTMQPTASPTMAPTMQPTASPTMTPTAQPTAPTATWTQQSTAGTRGWDSIASSSDGTVRIRCRKLHMVHHVPVFNAGLIVCACLVQGRDAMLDLTLSSRLHNASYTETCRHGLWRRDLDVDRRGRQLDGARHRWYP
jgi:hypothetical protein